MCSNYHTDPMNLVIFLSYFSIRIQLQRRAQLTYEPGELRTGLGTELTCSARGADRPSCLHIS